MLAMMKVFTIHFCKFEHLIGYFKQFHKTYVELIMPRKHGEGNYSNGWWLSMLHSLAKA